MVQKQTGFVQSKDLIVFLDLRTLLICLFQDQKFLSNVKHQDKFLIRSKHTVSQTYTFIPLNWFTTNISILRKKKKTDQREVTFNFPFSFSHFTFCFTFFHLMIYSFGINTTTFSCLKMFDWPSTFFSLSFLPFFFTTVSSEIHRYFSIK